MISTLFADPVVAITATEAMGSGELMPEEAACIGRAVGKRAREFTAGRAVRARSAGEARHPRVSRWSWAKRGSPSGRPASSEASPTARAFCGVAVARQSAVVGLGLDVERAEPLAPKLLARICTPRERERLAPRAGAPDPGKLTFCAKESFYKCYFPLTRTFLGFQDVEVEFEPGLRGFRARLVRAQAPSVCGVRELEGRLAWNAAFVCSGVSLRAP